MTLSCSCVHELFEQQVSRSPDSPALVLPSQDTGRPVATLSYAELNSRADRVALELMELGVDAGQFVALRMDRSIEVVVAMLAVLKAGGAYVPLDPSYPAARINFMMSDTSAPVVIAQESSTPSVSGLDAKLLVLRDGGGLNKAASRQLTPPAVDPESLAYVMYTSGSTGQPKGVMVPHRGIVRLVRGGTYARLDSSTSCLQLAPLSFDAATFEIWGPLLNGGICVLYPGSGVPQFSNLKRVIETNNVTTLWLTASLFNMIVDEAPLTLAGASEVLTGGEALSVKHVLRAQKQLPEVQFINGYGPTENTTFTCCYRIPRDFNGDLGSVPIGAPIEGTSVHILDQDLREVKDGEVGDLFIGGLGLALGYLNRPELTADRFIKHPDCSDGRVLYKSGDRGRWLPDDNIEFLGRLDDQVKIRGHRIELGEIEAHLREHGSVSDVVVILREDDEGDKQLVAYYTSPPCALAAAGNLRIYLAERVPEYMVPNYFVPIDSIPLTPNGKADRRALPAPASKRPPLDREYLAPRDAVEKVLAEHWCELLGLDRVGVHDRFFELGGTSMKAVKFIARLQAELQCDIPVVTVFEAGTVAEIAVRLAGEHSEEVAARYGLSRAAGVPGPANKVTDVTGAKMGSRSSKLAARRARIRQRSRGARNE